MGQESKNYYDNYTSTRFRFDPKRRMVWEEISKYLRKWINPEGFVIELGSGYCDWINCIKARRKIAIDKFINPKDFCRKSVEPIFGDLKEIKKIENDSVDVFLASNFFEHLTLKECEECLRLVKEKLKIGGKIIIIQPNYRYAYKNYFDDYTHLSVWSHESLKDFINANGLRVIRIYPKFLPLTMKSKFPRTRFLIRSYLKSPIKPMAGQMLVIARKM